MLVRPSDDQTLFRDTTARFVDDRTPLSVVRQLHDSPAGFERAWWAAAAELGWFSQLVPEDRGGGSVSGNGLTDAVLVAEVLGRSAQPGPFVPHNVVAWTLATTGNAPQHQSELDGLVAGTTVATWAPTDERGIWDAGAPVEARVDGDEVVVSGWRGFVPEAQSADLVLVPARLEGRAVQVLVPTDAAGITVRPLNCLDLSRRMAHVGLDQVRVASSAVLEADDTQAEGQLQRAVVLTIADTVGAMGALFDMAVTYAKDRIAFGRPIGAFQAIKHVLADQALGLESARAVVVAAATAVDRGDEAAPEVVSMAAAYVADVGNELAQEALQVHGGIGYTWEHDLHLLLRRVQSNAGLYGSAGWHRERVCAHHGLGEGSNP